MGTQPKPTVLDGMSADAFLDWERDAPEGRFELVGGEVVAMAPERAGHGRTKLRTTNALDVAIRAARLPCEALIDSVNVRVAGDSVYKPDAIVRCGPPVPDDATTIADPVVVVEVLSPSTRHVDTGEKLKGYFSLPSLRHYLILNPKDWSIIHHRRAGEGRPDDPPSGPPNGPIETRILHARAATAEDGAGGEAGAELILDPPGLAIACGDLFQAP